MKINVLLLAALFLLAGTVVFAQTEIGGNTSQNVVSEAVTGGIDPNFVQLAMSSPNYRVTAGDVYTLAFAAGNTPVTYRITVDSTYRIRVSNLGVIDASGKTFNQLKIQVEDIVSRNYPLSGVQFVLSAPALFTIQVKGEVARAGERSAWALQRLSAFVTGGNLTAYSSLRDVKVTSSSGRTTAYDLFKASRLGDFGQDPYVRPGDVITVSRIDRSVTISGSVERPGAYQLLKGENLIELINTYANGFTPLADKTRLELVRRINTASISGEKINLPPNCLTSNYELQNMDTVTVPDVTRLRPVMFLEGAISEPVVEGTASTAGSRRMSITFEYGEDYGSLVRRNRTQLSVLADFANASILRNGAHIALNLTPLLLGDDSQNAQQVLENDTLVIPFYKQSLGFSQSGSTANASVTAASAAVTGGVNPQNVQIAMSSPDYPVTPGDVYTLAYAAGSESVTYSIAVDTTYQVRVANLDIVDATGKTFNQLKTQVETIVSENYPLSGVQLALTAPALFTIQIKGEVAQAGERQVWALQRLSTFAAGDNLTAYSSIRDVKITSSSGSTATYDLFKAGRFGDLSQDPYVRPGDVITVNRVDRVVTIGGAMERPGRYQLLPGENLSELVAFYANGATPAADTSRIELIRLIGGKEESGDKLYLTQTDIAANFDLQHMDAITIPVITDLMPVMFVEGAVLSAADAALESSNRLTVRFNMGENYATLVRRNRAWFSPVSDTQKAYIVRGETRIHLDLNPLLYDSNNRSEEDVQDSDVLVIPFRQYFVSVAGAVMSPGRFPYIPDRDWEYYIGLAGGFNPDRNSLESIFIRNIDGTRLKKTDPITPETTITAHTNSFLYGFNRWAPIVTTVLSIITSFFTVMAVTGAL